MASHFNLDPTKSGLASEVYNQTASFGMFMANISAAIGTIIGIGLIAGGMYFLLKKEKYSGVVQANIIDAQCNPIASNQYQCKIKLEYSVNGQKYTKEIIRNDKLYTRATPIEMRYDPSNPEDIVSEPSSRMIGMIMLVVAMFILIGVWINWWIKRRFKIAAAAGGAGDVYKIFA